MKNKLMTNKGFRYATIGLMVLLGIVLQVLIIIVARQDVGQGETKSVADWGDKNEASIPAEAKRVEVHYEYSPLPSDGENSYWFVFAKSRGDLVYWNDFVKFDHSYFSMEEAFDQIRKNENQPDAKLFLIDFEKVSEATFIANKENEGAIR